MKMKVTMKNIFAILFLVFILTAGATVTQAEVPKWSIEIVVELKNPEKGHLVVKETLENSYFSEQVRKAIVENKTIIEKISTEEIVRLNVWLDNATFTNSSFQFLNLDDYEEPLQSQTEADFCLNYTTKIDDDYIFRNLLFFGEIYESPAFKLILPKGFKFVSAKPQGFIILKKAGREIIHWNLTLQRNDIELFYVKEVAWPWHWYVLIGILAVTACGVSYLLIRRRK